MAEAILAENVCKAYSGFRLFGRKPAQSVRYALHNVSFVLRDGETLGLLGPNGAGKTTLLKIIATLLSPTSGHVKLHGHDINRDVIESRRQIGLVTSDERSFYWRLTGRQNLMFFAALYGVPERAAAARIDMLLEVLGLTAAADRPFLGYSSGMKQKMAIARGLMNEPRILLYDEPTRALDPLSAQQIRHWIQENQIRAPHQAHLLATNQLQEAEQLSHRVLIINQGTVIACGTIDDIREDWRKHDYAVHRVTCRGVPAGGWLTVAPELGLLEITREQVDTDTVAFRLRTLKRSEALHYVFTEIIEQGGKILQCDSEEVSFDSVFCALVTGNSGQAPQVYAEARE